MSLFHRRVPVQRPIHASFNDREVDQLATQISDRISDITDLLARVELLEHTVDQLSSAIAGDPVDGPAQRRAYARGLSGVPFAGNADDRSELRSYARGLAERAVSGHQPAVDRRGRLHLVPAPRSNGDPA